MSFFGPFSIIFAQAHEANNGVLGLKNMGGNVALLGSSNLGNWALSPDDDAPPSARVASVDCPSSMDLGATLAITMHGENTGGPATEGDLQIAFPGLTDANDVAASSDINVQKISQGELVWADYGQDKITTRYVLIDAYSAPWNGGDMHYLSISLTPRESGTFQFEVKLNLQYGLNQWAHDPADFGGIYDQQNEWARSYTVQVRPPQKNNLDFAIDLLVPQKNSYDFGETPRLWARVMNTGSSTIDPYELRGYFTVVSASGSTIDAGSGDSANGMEPGKIDLIENTDHAWTIPSNAETGLYTLKVTITSIHSGISHSGELNNAFSVNAPPAADFQLSITPTSQVVTQGQPVAFSITVTSLNGWTMPVTLSMSGLPNDASPSFSANPVTPTGTSTLSLTTEGTGQFGLVVIGDSGGRQHTTSATLVVQASQQPEFDYGIAASQSSVVIQRGQASYACTVTISLTSGASGRVDLSLSGLPSGVGIYSFSPPYDNPPFTATLSIGTLSGAPTGDYPLTIVGSGGGKTKSTTLTLTVTAEPPAGSFKPYRSSFQALPVGSSIQASLGYEDSLGEDVIVIFLISVASSGVVVDAPTDKAHDATSGTVSATSKPMNPDTYEVSWMAYRASDTSLSTPIAWSTTDEIKTLTIGGGTGSAQISAVSTDKVQYDVGENVKISITIVNGGNTQLDLRVVIDVVDSKGNVLYDSHPVGQDKRYPLGPGDQASGEFTWPIPSNSACGTYRVEASLRDWNNWDTIFDYRWGDKQGPAFEGGLCEKRFAADHSSFQAWVTLAGNRIFFLLDYKNGLSEDVLIVFFISDLNGNIFPSTSHLLPIFGNPSTLARKGAAGTVHASSSELRATTYRVFWKAYLTSDTHYARPIDESTDDESKVFVSSQGYEAISHSIVYFNGEIAKEYALNNYALQAYRYHVEPGAPNTVIFDYYDEALPFKTKFLLPTDPERTFTVFIPSEIQVQGVPTISNTGGGSAQLVKTHLSSRVISNTRYEGSWYTFKITADMGAVAYFKWEARFTFRIENPVTEVCPMYVSSATTGEVLQDNVMDVAVDKFYEYIQSKVTGEPWFSPYDIAEFVASVTLDTLASHQIVVLDPIESGQSLEVTITSKFVDHPTLGTQDFTDLKISLDELERYTPVTLELMGGSHLISAPSTWKTGGAIQWLDLKFDHWEDEKGATVSKTASFTFNIERKVTLFAIYKPSSSVRIESKEQVFSVLDSYFSNTPSAYTDNHVPTKEDIFRLLDEYFGED